MYIGRKETVDKATQDVQTFNVTGAQGTAGAPGVGDAPSIWYKMTPPAMFSSPGFIRYSQTHEVL